MKKFLFTSGAFEGEVIFEFKEFKGEDGVVLWLLTKFDSDLAELSDMQQRWLLTKMPKELSEVRRVIGTSPTAILTEVLLNLTFDIFWNRYGEKIRSSKKRTIAKWNKMTESERGKAYRFIPKYEGNMQPGTNKKYAETYLNDELWNN